MFRFASRIQRRRGPETRERRRGQRHGFRELEEDPDRVHQQPAAGTGTGVRQQHVPVAAQADRDRQLSAALREAGEDLVPEQAGQAQEGGRDVAGRAVQLPESLPRAIVRGVRRQRLPTRRPPGRRPAVRLNGRAESRDTGPDRGEF